MPKTDLSVVWHRCHVCKRDWPFPVGMIGTEIQPREWICVGCADAKLAALKRALRETPRPHFHCDDSFFCCSQCNHPDHELPAGEVRGGPNSPCDCGVDAWITALLDKF